MIRNTKYICAFAINNAKSFDENVKLMYDLAISKRDNYVKTNQYIFIQNDFDVKVYQLLNIESKYPKKFYKGDIVECKEHGRGIVISIKKTSFTKVEVQFDSGIRDSYTYSGYKFPLRERNNPRNKNPFAYDKIVKL